MRGGVSVRRDVPETGVFQARRLKERVSAEGVLKTFHKTQAPLQGLKIKANNKIHKFFDVVAPFQLKISAKKKCERLVHEKSYRNRKVPPPRIIRVLQNKLNNEI